MKLDSPVFQTTACSTRQRVSYAGTINGLFLTSFCPRLSDSLLQIRCFEKARSGFARRMADSYHSSLPTQLIATATLRFATVID